jgi:plasmid maintenance system killer protein
VQLAFATKSLRDLCESEIKMKEKLRSDVASVLQHRLADLSAASSMADLVASPPVQLDGSRGKRYVIELCGGHHLVIRPNHSKVSQTGSGVIDWPSVNRVLILSIGQAKK